MTAIGWEVSTTAIMVTSLRGRRRHRSWSEALKREIVAASLAPGASGSVVARQYDVNSNLVFSWRKRYGDAPNAPPAAQLVPVMVTPDRIDGAPPPPAADAIEIELPSGYSHREPHHQGGPFWTPITPPVGSFFHADSQPSRH
jgi:transposase